MSEDEKNSAGQKAELDRLRKRVKELEFLLTQQPESGQNGAAPLEGGGNISQDPHPRERNPNDAEHNFRDLFDSLNHLLFVLDQQGRILQVNRAVTALLEYGAEELVGQSVLMVHPADRREEAARVIQAILAGQTELCTIPIQNRFGRNIPVETRVMRGIWNGQAVLFGVTRHLSNAGISQEKFARIFQASPGLMAINDLQTQVFLEVNDAFLKTLGYTADEVIGQTPVSLNLIVNEAEYGEAIQKFEKNGFLRNFQASVRTKSGEVRLGDFSVDQIQLPDQIVCLTIMNDLTEQKRAEQAQLQSAGHLQQILEQMPYPVEVCTPEGTACMVNQAFLNMFGIPSAKLVVGKYNVFQDDLVMNALGLETEVRQVYAGEKIFVSDIEIPLEKVAPEYQSRKQGVLTEEVTMFPVFDANGALWRVVTIWKDVFDRKQSEEILKKREREFKSLLDHTPDVIARFDRQYRHLYVNPAVEKEFGIKVEELLGKTHRESGQPQEMAEWSEGIIRKVFEDRRETVFEIKIDAGEDSQYYLSRGVPEFDENSSVESALFIHRNITSQKKVEEALRRANLELTNIFHALPDLYFRLSATGEVLDYKAGGLAELFVPPEKFLGKKIAEILPAHVATLMQKAIETVQRDHKLVTFEYSLPMPKGEQDYEARLLPFEDGQIIAVARNISERKHTELALRESELRYRRLVENMPGIVYTFSTIEGGTYYSANASQILGYSAEYLRKHPFLWNESIHPNDLHRVAAAIRKARKNRSFDVEYRLRDSRGKWHWMLDRSIEFHQEKGETLIKGLATDITELKTIEAALKDANQQLKLHIQEIEGLQAILRDQAIHDPLTGIYNRRYMEEAIQQELSRAERGNYHVSMVMMDIDHFKNINDTYGHHAGDQVLQVLGAQLKLLTRVEDIVCRYGGEEFLVIMHNINPKDSMERAEQWRKAMEQSRIEYKEQILHATISCGVALFPEHGKTMQDVINAADEAMYRAKNSGRNRVVLYQTQKHQEL